jgi:hypothetical protein
MDVAVVLIVITIVVAGAYLFFSARNARERQRVSTVPAAPKLTSPADVPPVVRSAVRPVPAPPVVPPPLFDIDLEPPVVTPPAEIREIRWFKQFDPRSGSLDDTARLRLIGDLGVIAKEWCVPLLSAAYEEERRPGHRQAALIALAACRTRAAAGTFRLALASGDAAERAIAADGLADLEPPPQAKLRRTVERH